MRNSVIPGLFAVAGPSFAVLIAACIPSRDNRFDPAHAPVAKVVARVCGQEGGTVAPTPCPSGLQGTRRTLFQFDASGSFDPYQGSALSYAWDLDGSGTFATQTAHAPYLTTTVGLPASSLPAGGVGSAQRTVQVRVSTPDGRKAVGAAIVIVVNNAPVVNPGEDLFVPAHTGGPVILDACGGMPAASCTSFDPDGDRLTWTWQRTDGPMPAGATLEDSGARLVFAASMTDGTMTFRLTGSDGLATNGTLTQVVTGTQMWVQTPDQLFRIFPEFATIVDTTGGGFAMDVDPVTGRVWSVSYSTPIRIYSADLDVVEVQNDYIDLPAQPVNTFVDGVVAVGSGACITFASSRVGFMWVDSNAQPVGPLAIAPSDNHVFSMVARSRLPQTCWAATTDALFLFNADSSLTPVLPGTFSNILAISGAPDGSLFVLEQNQVVRVDASLNDSVVYSVSAEVGDFNALPTLAADPGGDGVWVADQYHREITWVHANATAEAVATGIFPAQIAIDPVDESVWASDSVRNGVAHFTNVAGIYVQDVDWTFASVGAPNLSPNSDPTGIAVNPLTRQLLLGVREGAGFGTGSGIITAPSLALRTSLVPFEVEGNPFAFSSDPTRGTLWGAANGGENPIERVASSGRVLGSAVLSTSIQTVDALADGSAWVGAADSLFQLDPNGKVLATLPITGHTLSEGTGDADGMCASLDSANPPARAAEITYGATAQILLHPIVSGPTVAVYVPARAPDGSCWYYDIPETACGNTVALHYSPGVAAPVLTVSLAICPLAIAIDPLDSSAWFATASAVVHVAVNGSTTSTPLTLPSLGGLHVRARCSDPTNLACRELWYASDTAVLKAVGSAPATIVDAYTLPNEAAGNFPPVLTARP